VSHLQHYVSRLELAARNTVLDIGCGRGQLLQLVLSQYNMRSVGADSSPYAIADSNSLHEMLNDRE
jgi:cyclopropane fatty-acyl-phospholipid synthase-like methyltransferase